MFPFRVENPRFGLAIATAAIIALNLLVWIAIERVGAGATLPNTLCTLGLIPLGEGIACTMGSVPAWLTPLTSMFMHGGWFHLIGNMWFLWLFGRNVEDVMGPARYTVFYLLAGLAAAAAQVLADPGSALPMVGASGAISGVMGAYVVLFPKVRVHVLIFLGIFVTTVTLPAYMMLGYWFLLQVLGGSVNALQAAAWRSRRTWAGSSRGRSWSTHSRAGRCCTGAKSCSPPRDGTSYPAREAGNGQGDPAAVGALRLGATFCSSYSSSGSLETSRCGAPEPAAATRRTGIVPTPWLPYTAIAASEMRQSPPPPGKTQCGSCAPRNRPESGLA